MRAVKPTIFENRLVNEGTRNLSSYPSMPWAKPEYKRSQVDAAGSVLVAPDPDWYRLGEALEIINNWRSSHSFPLNTFQVGLRRMARHADPECLVAQRIKRLSSIEDKLRRFHTMKLSQMQDIGGCRAVVKNVRAVKHVADLYLQSDLKHRLDHIDNYIEKPKRSGYRGIHLIYRYFSDKNTTYNGLKIEVQIRSPLQHAWATAVETVGTFIRQALKSSRGEEEWLHFFKLMGTAIALREKTPPVPDTPDDSKKLVRELKHYARSLDVEARLTAYGAALKTWEQSSMEGARYYLLHLDPGEHTITIRGFKARELEQASEEYLAVEKAIAGHPGSDAVLVSVESLASLRRAYPNYFLDTHAFIKTVKEALSG